MRWLTAGESHGPELVAILEGMPAGVAVTTEEIAAELARRRRGHGRGARMSFEADELSVVGGVRHGRTLGSPVAVRIANSEWPRWQAVMSPDPVDPAALRVADARGDARDQARGRRLTRPRPGHADLAGMIKHGFDDARDVLERASARETAARVALGALARAYLRQLAGVEVLGHVIALGGVTSDVVLTAADAAAVEESPVRCPEPASAARMIAAIDAARSSGDTLGGIVQVSAFGVPPGLGSYTQWDRRLDARLAQALMSIPAVKGVAIGQGWEVAARPGTQAHDEIAPGQDGIRRLTNRAGGVEGGVSNGEPVVVSAAVKPISTVPRALGTVDLATGEPASAHHQRSDTSAVVPAAVVAEAMVCLVLAETLAEKVGGDSLDEARRNLAGYLAAVPPTHRLGGRS